MIPGINFQPAAIACRRIEFDPLRPTVIFLHDSLGSIELWRDFPEQFGLLSNFNILIYDRQGYGKSPEFSSPIRNNDYLEIEADLLHALLDHWNLHSAILFGHSDGASIALIAAAKYPEKISAVITEGAHVFVEDVTIDGINQSIDVYNNTDLKSRLEKYHGDKTDKMFHAWADTWTSKEFREWNIEDLLPRVTCPVLVIQGEDDEYGSLKQVDSIVSKTSGAATKLIIPGVGHTPHKEIPELVLSRSYDFIATNLK